MIPFIVSLMGSAGVSPLVDELDSLTGWTSVIVSTNDDGNSGSASVFMSNPFSGTGSFRLVTADLGTGGSGDYGRTSLTKSFSNPGYSQLRVAFAAAGSSTGPTISGGGSLSLISNTATAIASPSVTSPAFWYEQLYSIMGAGASFTVILQPASTTGTVYYDKLELF